MPLLINDETEFSSTVDLGGATTLLRVLSDFMVLSKIPCSSCGDQYFPFRLGVNLPYTCLAYFDAVGASMCAVFVGVGFQAPTQYHQPSNPSVKTRLANLFP